MTAVSPASPVSSVERPTVELDATTLIDGDVRCPCERNGRTCDQLLGRLTTDAAEFYCRACKVTVAVTKPAFGISSQNGSLTMNVQNPTAMELFALILTSDQQAATLRAAALEYLRNMPAQMAS